MHADVDASDCTQGGCTDAVRESALKVDSGRKIHLHFTSRGRLFAAVLIDTYQYESITVPVEPKHKTLIIHLQVVQGLDLW